MNTSLRILFFASLVCGLQSSIAIENRELVIDPAAKNRMLLVGVSKGLPGIDKDLNMMEAIGTNSAYSFVPTRLWNSQGTVANVAEKLTQLSSEVDEKGTVFFYYSGHGSPGSISLSDRSMKISQIRGALEQGVLSNGPLARLVLMFDSCYSGSLVDPLRKMMAPLSDQAEAVSFADKVVKEFTMDSRASDYWKSLFVFASSRSNETSNAGSAGSEFTVALNKAFGDVVKSKGTLAEWVSKTKNYTQGHHPVERFSPQDLANEKLIP